MNRYRIAATLLFVLAVVAPGRAYADPMIYTLVNLGVPNGFDEFEGLALNESGQVVGGARLSHFPRAAVVWHAGTFSVLDDVFGRGGSATAINERGEVAGYVVTPEGEFQAVRWTSGSANLLDVPISDPEAFRRSVRGTGISDDGTVVGTLLEDVHLPGGFSRTTSRAVVWPGIEAQFLPGPGGTCISANAASINNSAQIAGTSGCGAGQRATIWENGARTPLPVGADGISAFGLDINESGQVAGWVANTTASPYAARWSGGVLENLDVRAERIGSSLAFGLNDFGLVVGTVNRNASVFDGANIWDLNLQVVTCAVAGLPCAHDLGPFRFLVDAYDINNRGQILGRGFLKSGVQGAFLLTPCPECVVPEPSVLALSISAVILVAGRRLRVRGSRNRTASRPPSTSEA
jgi:uncharacterized membrane protein